MQKKYKNIIRSLIFSFLIFSENMAGAEVLETTGDGNICVRFGVADASRVIYEAKEGVSGTEYSVAEREGDYVWNDAGWIVQNDYSDAGRIADETSLIRYLNDNRDELRGTELTLLRVERDGCIYDDGTEYISILGDSISTLSGVTDQEGYNSHTQGHAARYRSPKDQVNRTGATLPLPAKKTWWNQVIKETGAELLVNSSVRGETVKQGMQRWEELKADRNVAGEMHAGTAPDKIIVYLGINDYRGYNMTTDLFYQDYVELLSVLAEKYQYAEIYCIELTDCYVPFFSEQMFIDQESGITEENWDGTSFRLRHFNQKISEAVHKVNAEGAEGRIYLVPLSEYNEELLKSLTYEWDEDMTKARSVNYGAGKTWIGLHPDANGHAVIAEAVCSSFSGETEAVQEEGAEQTTEQYDPQNVWRLDTSKASYSRDGARLYLDEYEIFEDSCIKAIQIPIVCVRQNPLDETSGEIKCRVSVVSGDGSGGEKAGYDIIVPRQVLQSAYLKNFHKKGEIYSQLADSLEHGTIQYEWGGRVTGNLYKDYYYIGEYIEIAVDICVGKDDTLIFSKDNTSLELIDSGI